MKKNICKKCYHDCHCDGDLHADEYGICTCENCKCEPDKELNKDSFNEV
tara:strand:+ start:690 stop:836 length:147 start_codon:yes stop_codon:yes gene_type:complete